MSRSQLQRVLVPDVWLLAAALGVLMVIAPALTHSFESRWSGAAPLVARIVLFSVAYLALLGPTVVYAAALGQHERNGNVVTTADRRQLMSATRPTLSLLLVVGALLAGNVYWLLNQIGWPIAVAVTGMFGYNAAADTLVFMVLAFATIVVQAYLLIDWPFSQGQTQYKTSEVKRATAEVRDSADDLAVYLASVRDGLGAQAGESTGLVQAHFELDRRTARHALAQERAQDAQKIPIHTFNSLADLLKKGVRSALLSALAALLKEGNPGISDVLTPVLKSLLG